MPLCFLRITGIATFVQDNEIPIRKLEDARRGYPDWYQVTVYVGHKLNSQVTWTNESYDLFVTVDTAANYTITATAGTGETISPEGDVGEDKGAMGSYTFSNISEAHTIEASFSKIQYTLIFKPDTGENDIILTAEYGDQVPAPGVAKDGYVFAGWKVDGSDRIYAEGEAVPIAPMILDRHYPDNGAGSRIRKSIGIIR